MIMRKVSILWWRMNIRLYGVLAEMLCYKITDQGLILVWGVVVQPTQVSIFPSHFPVKIVQAVHLTTHINSLILQPSEVFVLPVAHTCPESLDRRRVATRYRGELCKKFSIVSKAQDRYNDKVTGYEIYLCTRIIYRCTINHCYCNTASC